MKEVRVYVPSEEALKQGAKFIFFEGKEEMEQSVEELSQGFWNFLIKHECIGDHPRYIRTTKENL